MSSPELERIDFNQGRLKGRSGKNYFITSTLSVDKFSQFIAFQPGVTKGATYAEWAASNNEVVELLTSGNDILGSIHKAVTICMNMNATWKEFGERRVHATIWMAMLFIVGEDEDPGIFDERVIAMNLEDLKHYNAQDFFFLGQKLLSEWSEDFRRMKGVDPIDLIQPNSVEKILSQVSGSSSPE